MHELRVEGLSKWYGRREVLAVDHVDLSVEAGDLLVLLGPSGCGKTTLLRCIAGLEEAQEGRISLEGRRVFDAAERFDLPTHKRDIGMVFQNYSLWPHMSVEKNVLYPLQARGMAASEGAARVRQVLQLVQCEHLAGRLPAMLSGGQQQRVALARALASKPAIMLLDEPLSNLDALLRVDLRAELRSIHREIGFTGVYVTHDQTEAFSLGTHVAVMRAGRVEQFGDPGEVYARPATEYVARFLGISNALPLTREGASWRGPAGVLRGEFPGLGAVEERANLFIRPEDLQLAPLAGRPESGGTLGLGRGTIVDAVFVGGEIEYEIDADGTHLSARKPASGARFRAGDSVALLAQPDAVHIYREERLVG